jgi:hypothetical protein
MLEQKEKEKKKEEKRKRKMFMIHIVRFLDNNVNVVASVGKFEAFPSRSTPKMGLLIG